MRLDICIKVMKKDSCIRDNPFSYFAKSDMCEGSKQRMYVRQFHVHDEGRMRKEDEDVEGDRCYESFLKLRCWDAPKT